MTWGWFCVVLFLELTRSAPSNDLLDGISVESAEPIPLSMSFSRTPPFCLHYCPSLVPSISLIQVPHSSPGFVATSSEELLNSPHLTTSYSFCSFHNLSQSATLKQSTSIISRQQIVGCTVSKCVNPLYGTITRNYNDPGQYFCGNSSLSHCVNRIKQSLPTDRHQLPNKVYESRQFVDVDNSTIFQGDSFNSITEGQHEGGCLYVGTTGTVTVISCTFQNCSSTHGNLGGGCIYLKYGTLNVETSNFTLNWANRDAGAIYLHGGKSTISKCNFDHCLSKGSGGVLSCYGAELTLQTSTFLENEATENGGVLSFDMGTSIYVQDCAFIQNHAGKSGGAGAFYGNRIDSFTIRTCTFESNLVSNPSQSVASDIYFTDDGIKLESVQSLLSDSTSTSSQPRVCIGGTGHYNVIPDKQDTAHVISQTEGNDEDGCGGFSSQTRSNSNKPCRTISRFLSELKISGVSECNATITTASYIDSCMELVDVSLILEAEETTTLTHSGSTCTYVLSMASGNLTISGLSFLLSNIEQTNSNTLSPSFFLLSGPLAFLKLMFCTILPFTSPPSTCNSHFLLASSGKAHLTRCDFSKLSFLDANCIKIHNSASLVLTDSKFDTVTTLSEQESLPPAALLPSSPFPSAFGPAVHADLTDSASLLIDNTTFTSCTLRSHRSDSTVCGGCVFIHIDSSSSSAVLRNSRFSDCTVDALGVGIAGSVCLISQHENPSFSFRSLTFFDNTAKIAKSLLIATPSVELCANNQHFDKAFLTTDDNDMLACNLTSTTAVPIVSLFPFSLTFYLSVSGSESEECGNEGVPCRTFSSAFATALQSVPSMGSADSIEMIVVDSVVSNSVLRLEGVPSLQILSQGSDKAVFECLSPVFTESEEGSVEEDGMLIVIDDTSFHNIHFKQTCNLGAQRSSLFHHISGTLTLSSCVASCINDDRRIEYTFLHSSGGQLIVSSLDASQVLFGDNRVPLSSSTSRPACLLLLDESATASIDGLVGSEMETDSSDAIIVVHGRLVTFQANSLEISDLNNRASFLSALSFAALSINQSSFAGITSTAASGGAVRVHLLELTAFSISNTSFSDCSVISSTGCGGGIYATLQPSSLLVISGCSFTSCQATGTTGVGAAICVALSEGFQAVMVMSELTFMSCSSKTASNLAIVCADAEPTLVLSGLVFGFSDNTSEYAAFVDGDLTNPLPLTSFVPKGFFVSSEGVDETECGKHTNPCGSLAFLMSQHLFETADITIVPGSALVEECIVVIGTFSVESDPTSSIMNKDVKIVFDVGGNLTLNSVNFFFNSNIVPQPPDDAAPSSFILVRCDASVILNICQVTTQPSDMTSSIDLLYPFIFITSEGTLTVDHSKFTLLHPLNVPLLVVGGGMATISETTVSDVSRNNDLSIYSSIDQDSIVTLNSAFLHIQPISTTSPAADVSIKQCSFSNISVNPEIVPGWSSNGGVIHAVLQSSPSFLTIADTTFSQITLGGLTSRGGAVYIDTSDKTYQLTSLQFSQCSAPYGSAVFITSGSLSSAVSKEQFAFDMTSLDEHALEGQDISSSEIVSLLSFFQEPVTVVHISTPGSSASTCGSETNPCSGISAALKIPQTQTEKNFVIDSTVDCFGIDSIGAGEYVFGPSSITATLKFMTLKDQQRNDADTGMITVAGKAKFSRLIFSGPDYLHKHYLFLVTEGELDIGNCVFEYRGSPSNPDTNTINYGVGCSTGGSVNLTTFTISSLAMTDIPLFSAKGSGIVGLNGVEMKKIKLVGLAGIISVAGQASTLHVQGATIEDITIQTDCALVLGTDCGRVRWIANFVENVATSSSKGSVMRLSSTISHSDDNDSESIIISDNTFTNCSAGDPAAFGGCLYISLSNNASLSIVDAQFTKCSAPLGIGGVLGLVLDKINPGLFTVGQIETDECSASYGMIFAAVCSNIYTQLRPSQFQFELPTDTNTYIVFNSPDLASSFELSMLFNSVITVSSSEGHDVAGCGKSGAGPCASVKEAVKSAKSLKTEETSIVILSVSELPIANIDIGSWKGQDGMKLTITGTVETKLVASSSSNDYGMMIGAGHTTITDLSISMNEALSNMCNTPHKSEHRSNSDFANAVFVVGSSGTFSLIRCLIVSRSPAIKSSLPLVRTFGTVILDTIIANTINLLQSSLIEVEAGKLSVETGTIKALTRTSKGHSESDGAFVVIKSTAHTTTSLKNIAFTDVQTTIASGVIGKLVRGGVISATLSSGSRLDLSTLTFKNCSAKATLSKGGCVFVDESLAPNSFTFKSSSFDDSCSAQTGDILYLSVETAESVTQPSFLGTFSPTSSPDNAFILFESSTQTEIPFNNLFTEEPSLDYIVVGGENGVDENDCGRKTTNPCGSLGYSIIRARSLDTEIKTVELVEKAELTVHSIRVGNMTGENAIDLAIRGLSGSALVECVDGDDHGMDIESGSVHLTTLIIKLCPIPPIPTESLKNSMTVSNIISNHEMFYLGQNGQLIIEECSVVALKEPQNTKLTRSLIKSYGTLQIHRTNFTSLHISNCPIISCERGSVRISLVDATAITRTRVLSSKPLSTYSISTYDAAFITVGSPVETIVIHDSNFTSVHSNLQPDPEKRDNINGGVITMLLKSDAIVDVRNVSFSKCGSKSTNSTGGCIYCDATLLQNKQTDEEEEKYVPYSFIDCVYDKDCEARIGSFFFLVVPNNSFILTDFFKGTFAPNEHAPNTFVAEDLQFRLKYNFDEIFEARLQTDCLYCADKTGDDILDCGSLLKPCSTINYGLEVKPQVHRVYIVDAASVTAPVDLSRVELLYYTDKPHPVDHYSTASMCVTKITPYAMTVIHNQTVFLNISISLDKYNLGFDYVLHVEDGTLTLRHVAFQNDYVISSKSFLHAVRSEVVLRTFFANDVKMNSSLPFLTIHSSKVELRNFTMDQMGDTPYVRPSDHEQLCSFSDALMKFSNCTVTVNSSRFADCTRVPFSFVDGRATFHDTGIDRNGPSYTGFQSRQERIVCRYSTLELSSMWDKPSPHEPETTELKSLWVDVQEGCTLNGVKERPSYFFSPTFKKLHATELMNESKKIKGRYQVSLSGSNLLPCGISIEVVPNPSKPKIVTTTSDPEIINETKAVFNIQTTAKSGATIQFQFNLLSATSPPIALLSSPMNLTLPDPSSIGTTVLLCVLIGGSAATLIVLGFMIWYLYKRRLEKKNRKTPSPKANPFTLEAGHQPEDDPFDRKPKKNDEELVELNVPLTSAQEKPRNADDEEEEYDEEDVHHDGPNLIVAKSVDDNPDDFHWSAEFE
ncbi:hypothetical protein BLNAU_1512 [Blattamonas nauphoetae]|uniref:Uncharacterized protein n=1 Tax=Blattamonas nauphoetae TaxID=2049346 RepID=A0ABQ9YIQ2_9EUKA|nr:hypothetical protein BLNAU_1512 [Blattamonas nauphoetae]